ncbi:ParA family protein [Undibacterium oligocarboniphilum]|uniref:ParA family protein n=1 Tax=Undibacterium oligocarboniphilum TaxID=666702 RepID=A0A850QHN9_9BURK|nr:ParA family protein [Undibacterium oligocarboniphilum]MBC3871540.1 ParA family protein [Undibacterium oligocarboniphilum]NVO79101.1 ParA family protein [Undibacterium oligocarboniphilum]
MQVIAIVNPKGGAGKSTVATNLAGYLASRGHQVMLGDVDVQQSSRTWLDLRPASLPPITAWEVNENLIAKPPKGTTHVILDTPAGLKGHKLDAVLKIADRLIVPLQPSIFDILATETFLKKLARREQKCAVGVLGMRVNARSRAADQLAHYVGQLGLPVLGYLRDTQNYIQLAAHGATLWDVAPSRVEKDLAQWGEILRWLQS